MPTFCITYPSWISEARRQITQRFDGQKPVGEFPDLGAVPVIVWRRQDTPAFLAGCFGLTGPSNRNLIKGTKCPPHRRSS
jgi:hypothetical protein